METSRRLRLKVRRTVVPQPIQCSSPSPSARAAGSREETRRISFERTQVTKSSNFPMHFRTPSQPILAKIDLSSKDIKGLLQRTSRLSHPQDRYQGRLPEVASHSPSPNNSSKGSQESSVNYARRMRRIRKQVSEMAEMGLISSRGNEPLLSDFDCSKATLSKSRMNTAEFWGHKDKLELIKKLGFAEAYRDFEARKSVQKIRVLSPAHLKAEEALRRSCPVSPSVMFGVTGRSSGESAKPHISALNKIMRECDQFFLEKAANRFEATPKVQRFHMRSHSEAEFGNTVTAHAA